MAPSDLKRAKAKRRPWIKVMLLLTASLGGGIYYWLHSPTFALRELERSILEKDLATFYSRLDLDRIYDSSIDALVVIKTESAPDSPWESIRNTVGGGVTKVLKSQAMNTVKHEIETIFRGVELQTAASKLPLQPNPSSPSSPLTPAPLIEAFFSEIDALTFALPVRSDAKALANVAVHLRKMGKTYPLTLVLENLGAWRVTGFEGLSSTLSLYQKDQGRKLEEHNSAVQKQMAALVPFFGQVRHDDGLLGLGQQIHFEFLFQNRGESALQQIEGSLVVLNSKNEEVLKEPFRKGEGTLAVQEKKVFLIDKGIGAFAYKSALLDALTLQFKYDHVHFENGKDLATAASYTEL